MNKIYFKQIPDYRNNFAVKVIIITNTINTTGIADT